MELIIYLLIGAIAGFAAGLFGVGGGLIIVPILYIVFTQLQYDPGVIMHMAVGTSLATIIVTSISSVMAHHQKGAVLWHVFRNLAPGLIVGSFFGAGIADYLSAQGLQLLIGFFAVWVAFRMFRGAHIQINPNQQLPSAPLQLAAGAGIGVASAIFGIGGGSLTVPFLNRCGVAIQKAVATSAACGLPIALAGAIGFIWFGQQAQVNVANTIGYIHIYAFIGISLMSFFTAKQGAKVAHRLSPAMLKKCFAGLLTTVGLYFIYQGFIA
ncbi:sulfite exporter TauE/SafE family protein [Acinetobacter bohemicus]|uniref:sulfite exporter TauE/SafE family protein n=1 Tax=Acinetobacter TaxID=469 RepID=UPI00157BE962|nr:MULTISPECIES: sulfite exporter TauE/SafE family protein [Acinetobacter]MDM1781191.1 sulfite exporter TauE/SafE family protein [Acinetobacter indicus]MCO8042224.1 sulfite exporter TauE/SafE family protein [Acinetobacter sp. S4400-12]MCO8045316.1 sulfite exporter TauE/SafE family protein [Acinetobacter sp. S4397-1]MCU7224474.1 sulfite exporter TauE/SafE family protein [Acinetobacter bohemicus]QKQ69327.1 sulfite exporter TauE/SafE family protein [Acinetobacter sp. 10FS3-1]